MILKKKEQILNIDVDFYIESKQVFMVNKINIFQKKQQNLKGVSNHEQNNRNLSGQIQNLTYVQEDINDETFKAMSKPDILIKKPRSSMQLKKQQKTKKISNKSYTFEDNFIPENFKFQYGLDNLANELNEFDISMYTTRDQKLTDLDQEVDFETEFEKEVQKIKVQKQDWLEERLEFAKILQIQMAEEWELKAQLKKELKEDEEQLKPKKPKKEVILIDPKLKPFK